MSDGINVRKCETLEEFHACVALQREIWGEADLEVEPATMFVVASHTGGQVLGAFDGRKLVGYTLAVAGLRNGAPYFHSHMTGVQNEYRDRGVGRMLKLFQRDEALSREVRLIEWTFDPFELRNAHFNLNRLGAICRRYLPNLYGVTTSPLHRGMATDRLVAEWFLDSPRVMAALNDELASPQFSTPIDVATADDNFGADGVERLQSQQKVIRDQFTEAFAKGFAAVGISKTADGGTYLLAPWSDF
jgi:predicted GNAT superfamily acetyltransferase